MNRRGIIYLMSLGIVFFLTVLSASLLVRGISETQLSERSRSQHAAFQLADAAVDMAAINLRTADVTDDVLSHTLPTGTSSVVSVTQLGAQLQRVAVRGVSGSEQRNVEAVVQLIPQSIFQFALFGDQTVNVSGNAITDSYNSSLGPYDNDPSSPGYNAAHNGDIGTNATTAGGVAVSGSIFVDGQVAVGSNVADPTSVVTGYDPAFITGGTDPPSDTQDVVSQGTPFPMPAVTVPAGLNCPNETITSSTTTTLSPTGGQNGDGVYCYHNLTVQGNATLTASGEVTVYLTGRLIARGDSTVGVLSDPRQMTFLMDSFAQATLEQGTITGSTQLAGSLYGPQATIDIQGNAEVFGSIIAKTVNLTGSAIIHYDEALSTDNNVSNLFQTRIVSWREL